MIQVIRVIETHDIKGRGIFRDAIKINKNLKDVRVIKTYRLEGITEDQAKIIAEKILSEMFTQDYLVNKKFKRGGFQTVEIAYKPGVMNPETDSIIKGVSDL